MASIQSLIILFLGRALSRHVCVLAYLGNRESRTLKLSFIYHIIADLHSEFPVPEDHRTGPSRTWLSNQLSRLSVTRALCTDNSSPPANNEWIFFHLCLSFLPRGFFMSIHAYTKCLPPSVVNDVPVVPLNEDSCVAGYICPDSVFSWLVLKLVTTACLLLL